VEYRDDLKAADKFAVQEAIVFDRDDSGRSRITGGMENKMRNALLERIITAWSYEERAGVPVPSRHVAKAGCIGEVMDIDDYNTLAEKVEPLLTKMRWTAPNPPSSAA